MQTASVDNFTEKKGLMSILLHHIVGIPRFMIANSIRFASINNPPSVNLGTLARRCQLACIPDNDPVFIFSILL
jgi:hypothetical protein